MSIKLKVRVDHKRYYDINSMWGVFGVVPLTNKEKIETLDGRGVFAVTGNTPELTIGEEYDIEITPSYNKKYGKGYEFVMVAANRPETIKEQQDYLEMMVTEKQFEEIMKVYPNHKILDLMEEDKFDYTDMKGIGKATYERIKKYVFSNMEIQEALVALKDLDVTFKAVKNLIDHFNNAATLVQVVEEDIYQLCQVKGFGFRKVDGFAMNRGDNPTSERRIGAALKYVLEQDANSGNSWIEINKVENELEKLLEIHKGYVKDYIEEIHEKDKTIYKDEKRLAIHNNYVYESQFLEKVNQMINKPSHTQVNNIEEKIKEIENKNGITYTDEQRNAIKKAVDNNVMVLNGLAGAGKSLSLKGLVDVLSNYSYMSCSLSGKAAKVLKENGLQAKTIHKMLMETIDYEKGELVPLRYDIIIVDEASMVNSELFYRIVESMKEKSKLIIVGDNGQLPAIGVGANFDDIIRFGDYIPRQELTKVHRQAQKSGILSTANTIRKGSQINPPNSEETEIYGELKDMVLIPTSKGGNIEKIVLDIAKRNTHRDLFEFQVITGRVDSGSLSVKNLNIEMQKIFNDVNKPSVTRGWYNYREGDKIIQNGNNYEAHIDVNEFEEYDGDVVTAVFNGTLGRIEKIVFDDNKKRKDHKVIIKFEDEENLVVYNMEEINQIGLAYALTTHKVQGSGFNQLVFAFDGSSYMLLSREFIYTGVTRAKEGCIMIAESGMLHMGIRKSQGNNRKTFLKELLVEHIENEKEATL